MTEPFITKAQWRAAYVPYPGWRRRLWSAVPALRWLILPKELR